MALNVLIAEDDPVSRKLLQSYLEKWEYEVTIAENGQEAWRLFQQHDYPLVISDWMMPEVDGLELIRRIRAAAPADRRFVYAILVTAKSEMEDLVEGMEAGADDFVSKPFDRDELRVRVREGERIVRLERSLARQSRMLARVTREIGDSVAQIAENLGILKREAISDDRLHRGRASGVVDESLAEISRLRDVVQRLHDSVHRENGVDGAG